jgi:phage tail-like protein
MRGTVHGLLSPYPIGEQLPAVYQEDPMTMRWTEGLDEVLAPIIATLDNLVAYIDPMLAPEDFLRWLAEWFGADLDENWPLERQRAVVAEAVRIYRIRGTMAGLRDQLELTTGGVVDIADSGGVTGSATPTPTTDDRYVPWVSVRVRVRDPAAVSRGTLEEMVRAACPAHVPYALEVMAL